MARRVFGTMAFIAEGLSDPVYDYDYDRGSLMNTLSGVAGIRCHTYIDHTETFLWLDNPLPPPSGEFLGGGWVGSLVGPTVRGGHHKWG